MSGKNKAIVERADEKVKQKLVLRMSGGFLDYAAYNFPKPIVLYYNDRKQNRLDERTQDILSFFEDKKRWSDKELIGQVVWTSLIGATAEVDDCQYLFMNPVKAEYLSDSELAFIIFHEEGHLLGQHVELGNELLRIHAMIDAYCGEPDNVFNPVLSRYMEIEADTLAYSIMKEAGKYDARAYRTALLKFTFSFNNDKDLFQYEIAHPSPYERIDRLDICQAVDIDVKVDWFRERIEEARSADTVEKAMRVEEKWYKLLSDEFIFSRDGIVGRLNRLDKMKDERVFQYTRALEHVYSAVRTDKVPEYRVGLSKVIEDARVFAEQAKKRANKKLGIVKKGKIISRALINKGKEQVDEWMR